MNKNIKGIMKASTYTVCKGKYVYAKVSKIPSKGNHFMISKDNEEITVVTEYKNLKYLNLVERNKEDYSLISLNVSIPFYSVGFLAAVSSEIAKRGMVILIVSTYSKDYIMIKRDNLEKALLVLKKLGFKSR
jgi:hypothetical protein